MKIRNGHVSNSSSSSFIIGVDKPLDTIGSIKEQIFHNAGANTDGWVSHEYDYDPIHIDTLCEWFAAEVERNPQPLVFDDILNNEDILESLGHQILWAKVGWETEWDKKKTENLGCC